MDLLTQNLATTGAKYLTSALAQQYIATAIAEGQWPADASSLRAIFQDDLARTLHLDGTKDYFYQFCAHAGQKMATMLQANHGSLALSLHPNQVTAYQNLHHILQAYPVLGHTAHQAFWNGRELDLVIEQGKVIANGNIISDLSDFQHSQVDIADERGL